MANEPVLGKPLTTPLKMKLLSSFCSKHLESNIQLLVEYWDDLITQNTLALAASHFHLQYENTIKIRSNENPKTLPRFNKNRLLPEYKEDLKEVLNYQHKLNQEHSMLHGYLSAVLNRCPHVEDVFAMVPRSLHSPLYAVVTPTPGITSTAKLPDDLKKYHQKAIDWVELQNTRNFLLGK